MWKRSATMIVAVVALASAATAFAGNNGGGASKSSSSITLVLPSGASATAATEPSFGDMVTFAVSTTSANPWVNLQCFQNRALVAQGWANLAYASPDFTLSSPSWTGGAADCTASLEEWANGRMKMLASTSFHVNA
jgi:hypothetical protein